jgi:hypothetical protein
MDIIGGAIILIGLSGFIYSSIMIIIKAFNTSLLWGFGALFIPIVTLVYIVLNWDKTKKYVLYYVLGLLLMVIGGSLYNMR